MRNETFVVIAAAVVGAGGCARYAPSRPFEDEAQGLRRVDETAERPVISVSGPPRITPVPVRVVEATPLTAGDDPLAEVSIEQPVAGGAEAAQGGAVLIDAKVGDMNGRPIFAGEFFAIGPGARLAEAARDPRVTAETWDQMARESIAREMQDRLNNELLQAEARASLKPEVRMGLRAWLEDTAVEGRRRQAGGSRAAAERQMLEERNLTLEQWAREREITELVNLQIQRIIENQLNVSSRDLKLEYERSYEEFNPPPRAKLRLIRVSTENAEVVRAVQAALDAGEPFDQVASRPENTSNPENGGVVERAFAGDLKDARLFGSIAPLNEAVRGLEPGGWTRAPVVYDDWTAWVKLESVEIIRRPLTDEAVQLELTRRIRMRKGQELLERYVGRLNERASTSDIEDMKARLRGIAVDRYWRRR